MWQIVTVTLLAMLLVFLGGILLYDWVQRRRHRKFGTPLDSTNVWGFTK